MTNFEWRRKIHTCEKTIWRNFTVSVRNTMWKLPKFSQSLTHFFWQKFRESNVFSFFANHLMNDNSANWQYSEVHFLQVAKKDEIHWFHVIFVAIKCGNFRIFLTFRFYVKSILENIKVQKMLFFFVILGGSEFLILVNFSLQRIQKSKFRASKWGKMAVLGPLSNTWNWFHGKSEWQKNSEISTPQCGNYGNTLWKFRNFTAVHVYCHVIFAKIPSN